MFSLPMRLKSSIDPLFDGVWEVSMFPLSDLALFLQIMSQPQ